MKRIIKVILLLSLLQGCASAYQSQSKSFYGGYSDTQLDENVFQVSFQGNGYTTRERSSDFALLRSAELTLQNGFKYFVIVDAKEYSNTSVYTTPVTSTTTTNLYGTNNYAFGTATTTTYGGQTYSVSEPASSNTIVCFVEKPNNTFSYNAEFIYKNLTQKYEIQPTDN